MADKPLFIPLKTEYYEAFKSGKKQNEFRLHGKRWNEKTCYIGRQVILSKGYGKAGRIVGVIASFTVTHPIYLLPADYQAFLDCYGTTMQEVAIINIQLFKR